MYRQIDGAGRCDRRYRPEGGRLLDEVAVREPGRDVKVITPREANPPAETRRDGQDLHRPGGLRHHGPGQGLLPVGGLVDGPDRDDDVIQLRDATDQRWD